MSLTTGTTTTAKVNNTASDKQTKALEILKNGVMENLTSEKWIEALNFHKQFHNYSFNNRLLIALQRPEATHVAGYNKWQDMKRQVRKGEKGIAILAPIIVKKENDEGETYQALVGFKTVYVFDVSQTEGDEIPTLPAPKLLEGYDDQAGELLKRLEGFVAEQGWNYRQVENMNGANGSWNPLTKTVTLLSTLPTLSKAKTLAHEIAHAVAGHGELSDRNSYEFGELEAESTAYLVLNHFDLDTSSYSFNYIAGWAGDKERVNDVVKAGQNATAYADTIIKGISVEEVEGIAA